MEVPVYQSKEENVKCFTQENVRSLLFVDKIVIFAENIVNNFKDKEVHTKNYQKMLQMTNTNNFI